MSEKNHFVSWKGTRTGPFTKEELEREFSEGKLGLVRTILAGGASMSAGEFFTDAATKRREEELEEQLRSQTSQADAARRELQQKEEEHRQKLENASKGPKGKSVPPPIPDFNPWAPQGAGSPPPSQPKRSGGSGLSWWDGRGPIITAGLLCLACLLAGQILREASGILALVPGVVLLFRKKTLPGILILVSAILCYALGLIASDLIQDYMVKNYPN